MPMAGKHEDYEDDFDDEEPTAVNGLRTPKHKAKLGPYRQSQGKSPRRPTSGKKRPSSATAASKTARELWLNSVQGGVTSGGKGHPGKRSTVEYWVDTLRKSGEGISTESGKNSMTGLKRTQSKNLAYMSSSHYLRQLAGSEKTKKNGVDPTAKSAAGTPAYKDPEEYYDEIIALKKQIVSFNNDAATMKSKLRRLEEDNVKKAKEIENLLDPSKSDELRRTLTDRKPDAGAVIHSLKQKIHKLEQQLKEKETSLAKVQSDIKNTRIEEMRLQMEAYYQEVLRLSSLQAVNAPHTSRNNAVKESPTKLKALQDTILRMNEKNVRLTSENKSLKEDLEKMLEKYAKNKDIKSDYEDMSKKQLMNAIARLEKKLEKTGADSVSLMSDMDEKRKTTEGKIQLEGNINQRLDQLDKRETELLDELEKQRNLIKRLKDDRAHYRKKCEEKEKEIKALQAELDSFYDKDKSRVTPRPIPRRVSSASSDTSRGREAREKQKKIREFTENRAARHIQREWRHYREHAHDDEDEEQWHAEQLKKSRHFSENRAARRIQRGWHDHQSHKQESDDAALMIQSAMRGHASRRHKLRTLRKDEEESELTEVTESEDMESATELIQSSVRGHWARKDQLRKRHEPYSSRDNERRHLRTNPKRSVLDSEGEEDDLSDDFIVTPGSRKLTSSYRQESARSLGSKSQTGSYKAKLSPPTTRGRTNTRGDDDYLSRPGGSARRSPPLSRSKTPPQVLDDDDDDDSDDDDIIITSNRSKLF